MASHNHIDGEPQKALCRDCLTIVAFAKKCSNCHRPRLLSHTELFDLNIAHMDCDAFYASVEKRDNPALRDKPVIIGKGERGVVSTACYIARMSGVKSAMPIFKAKKLCPDGVYLSGNMAKYRETGLEIRSMMQSVTPLVEPLSIDEAFLDLSGTEKLHGAPPVTVLAKLVKEIEAKVGISISVGLAPNKFLAKLASDMQKPRGYTVIGRSDAQDILSKLPISRIYGIGKVTAEGLKKNGLTMISQLQTMDEATLIKRYGETGQRLYHLARGNDNRKVSIAGKAKSISAETTLPRDIYNQEKLEDILWQQCERTAFDLKKKSFAAKTITLRLKTGSFKGITRSRTLEDPTQLAETLFEVGKNLLAPLCDGTAYRLIGIGGSHLVPPDQADPIDLIEPSRNRKNSTERTMDLLKDRFGSDAIIKGRRLAAKTPKAPS